jgi:hypothetical protein
LVAKAEQEAEELTAAAQAEREDAAAKAVDLVARAEAEAEELSARAESGFAAERDSQLGARADLAAQQDALAMERQEFEEERASLQTELEESKRRQAKIDAENATILKKQAILTEAQDAFITERTLLQRRWAEVERESLGALERAHEQAEKILSEARERATEVPVTEPANESADEPEATTAQTALNRLDSVLAQAREVSTRRSEAELDAAGDDNDTAMSGVWNAVTEDSETDGADAPIGFDVPTGEASSSEQLP